MTIQEVIRDVENQYKAALDDEIHRVAALVLKGWKITSVRPNLRLEKDGFVKGVSLECAEGLMK
jgi:hypothetical protein